MVNIPSLMEEVTKEWLQTVFQSFDKTIEVKSIKPVATDSGWFSQRLTASIIQQDSDKTEKNIFIKIMPQSVEYKSFLLENDLHITELGFYQSFWKDLKVFCCGKFPEIDNMAPRCVAGKCNKHSFFLLLEDLSPSHSMIEFDKGFETCQLVNVVKNIACFHAVGYLYGKQENINFKSKYPFLSKFHKKFSTGLTAFHATVNDYLEKIENLVTGNSSLKHLAPYVSKLKAAGDIGKKISNFLLMSGSDFIIHGDLWINNVMVNHNGECKFVDWQFLAVGNIFFDFGLLAFLSVSTEDTEKHINLLTKSYYSEFSRICIDMKCQDVIPWSYQQFHEAALKQGMFITLIWCMSFDLSEKYADYQKRTLWILEKCVNNCPEYF